MNTRIGHEIGLEFGEVDIESTVEAQRRRDGGDDLSNQSVEVRVGWPLYIQITSANVIDGLVIDHERAVRVLEGRVSRKDGVIRFNYCRGHLGCRINGELEFGFLAIIDRESFHEEGGEAGTSATAERVEYKEALKTSALVGKFANTVKYKVDDFLADGVMTPGIVVGCVLFARY
jgi:hypothetical protein